MRMSSDPIYGNLQLEKKRNVEQREGERVIREATPKRQALIKLPR